MKHTIYDIAKVANVSKSTVSRVLNNSENISVKARNRVLQAIEELNYQPSKIARGLSVGFDAILVVSRSTKTTKNNPFFSEVLHVISRYTEDRNYDIILQSSQNNEEDIQKCISKTTNKIIKGIVMLSSPTEEKIFKEMDMYNIPIVVIGKVEGQYNNVYSVDTNNYQDSYNLIQYMIDEGHKDIACLYSPQEYHVSVDRLKGYLDCMEENGLPVREEMMVNCGFTIEDAYEATRILFSYQNQPTAIFATDDLKLMSLYKVLGEKRLSVPEDILVAGYSNMEITSFLFPSIIQIKNPTNELGGVASKLLFSIINGEEKMDKNLIIPTTRLIQKK